MILSGLAFERKGSGSVVIDTRKDKRKFVGIIVRRYFSIRYKLWSFVRCHFVFNEAVPNQFASIHNAEW